MNKTLIEWVKNQDGTQGYTWNPITGCLNGCEYCYARKLANGRLKSRYLPNDNIGSLLTGRRFSEAWHKAYKDPFYPRFWEDREWLSLRERIPKGIFVCDMSDLFGIDIPGEWTKRVIDQIRLNYKHRFYLLTKQPQNLIKFSPFPDNCWVGVTATNRKMWFEAVWELQDVRASVKYISFEPLLDWKYEMDIDSHFINRSRFMADRFNRAGISWVIIGAQTKPYKPPKIEWVKEIVEACDKAGIPVFLKDNLDHQGFPINSSLLNEEYYLRQEMPKVAMPS